MIKCYMYVQACGPIDCPLWFVLSCLTGEQKRKLYFGERFVILQNNVPQSLYFCPLYNLIYICTSTQILPLFSMVSV